MNIEKIEELADIIIKVKLDVATPQQREKLFVWLYANDTNLKIYTNIMSGDFLASRYMMEDENEQLYNITDIKREIIKKITLNRKKSSNFILYKRFAAAAAVAVLMWGGAELWTFLADLSLQRQSDEERKVLASAIVAYNSGKNAVLETSDGEKVELVREIDAIIENRTAEVIDRGDVKVKYNTISTPKGVTYNVTLSDGTKVWLNGDSKITYPIAFSGEAASRRVDVVGEAFFEVTRDTIRPFVVGGLHNNVMVLGTKFNFNSRESSTVTTLVEGVVVIRKGEREIILKPSQQAVAADDIVVSDVDVNRFIAWKDNKYIFKSERLSDVMDFLATWYDLRVEYENSATKDMKLSGVLFKFATFENIIEILEATKSIEIKIKDNGVIKVYPKR